MDRGGLSGDDEWIARYRRARSHRHRRVLRLFRRTLLRRVGTMRPPGRALHYLQELRQRGMLHGTLRSALDDLKQFGTDGPLRYQVLQGHGPLRDLSDAGARLERPEDRDVKIVEKQKPAIDEKLTLLIKVFPCQIGAPRVWVASFDKRK